MKPTVSAIGQIAITVSDVPTALRFYRDVLGLTFLFSPNPQLAFLAAGDVRLMLTTPQGAGAVGANSVLYFKVPDIVAAHAAVVARGATQESAPHTVAKLPDHELWLSFVRDPDGNLVGLMEEKRKRPVLPSRRRSYFSPRLTSSGSTLGSRPRNRL